MTPIDKRFVATWPECKGEGIYDDVGPSRPTNCPDDNDKLLISSSNGMVKWIGPIFVQLAFAIYNPLLYTYSCRFLKDEQKRPVHWTWMKSIDSSKPLGGGKKFFLESEAIKINETDFKDKNSPNAIKMRQNVKALQQHGSSVPLASIVTLSGSTTWILLNPGIVGVPCFSPVEWMKNWNWTVLFAVTPLITSHSI